MKVYIVGLGKVGRTLLNAYRTMENAYIYIYDRDRTKIINEIDNVKVFPAFSIEDIKTADTVFVTVIDRKVLSSMDEISSEFSGNTVIMSATISMDSAMKHIKGSRNVILMHPIQTFSDDMGGREAFAGIYFSVQYKGAKQFIDEFCDEFGCHYILADDSFNRHLYHASCIFASNFLVMMMKIASDLINKCGLSDEDVEYVLYPMMEKTVRNIKNKGIISSMTGPVMRGDSEVVKNHLKAIEDDDIKEIYKALIRKNIEFASQYNIEDMDKVAEAVEHD